MDITPSSKEKITEAKEKERSTIIGCDKAIADLKANIQALQDTVAVQTQVKQQAQNILKDLDSDFPDISGIAPSGA